MFVEIDTIIVSDDCPHTYIKFAPIKQKWMFNILLDHPRLGLWILLEDELIDVSQISKKLDSTTLVKRCRFYKPHVLLAVLDWYSLFIGATPCDLLVSCHKLIYFIIIAASGDDKSCWCCVKDGIRSSHSLLMLNVVLLKRSDQSGFGTNPSIVFKVIDEDGLGRVGFEARI